MPKPDSSLYDISQGELDRVVSSTPPDEYVIWTGGVYGNRDSLRFNAISKAVIYPGSPVSVRQILQHAARRDGTKGHRPALVKQGIKFHQNSRPTVFVWVRLGPDGRYRTILEVPDLHKVGLNVKAGTPIDPGSFR